MRIARGFRGALGLIARSRLASLLKNAPAALLGLVEDAQRRAFGGGAVSLARKSLIYDWRRYLAAVLAVAFSSLMVIVQLALLLGLFQTVSTVVDRAGADLWVCEGNIQSFDLARDMPERFEFYVRSNKSVARVERMLMGMGDWRTPEGGRVTVTMFGVDVGEESLGFPRGVSDELRRALRQAGTALIDRTDIVKLGVEKDRRVEINGRRMDVVGVIEGFRAIGGALNFVSESTLRELRAAGGASGQDGTSYFLVRLAPGVDIEAARAEINAAGRGLFRAMTPDELSVMSQWYWVFESGTGLGFLFSTALGLLVGVAITSQTLRAAILASLREYATLRALGIPLDALRRVVLEQSFWVGVVGLMMTAAGSACVWGIASAVNVAIRFTWWATLATAVFALGVSLASGVLALRPLFDTEPAELLR